MLMLDTPGTLMNDILKNNLSLSEQQGNMN